MKIILSLIHIIVGILLLITFGAKAQTITTTVATGSISACEGTPSISPSIEQFTVSGSNLAASITVAAPINFEVSVVPTSGFGANVILPQIAGNVAQTVIYVRTAANAVVGDLTGLVNLSSTGAITQSIAVTGIVNVIPSINPVGNQTIDNGYLTAAINFSGTAANLFNWINNTPTIGLPAVGSGDIAPFRGINLGTQPITATITAYSSYSGFAYIANTSSNSLTVINAITLDVVATIPGLGAGPRGVAVSPDGTRVYVASSSTNTLATIDATNNTVISTTTSGVSNPSGVAVSPDGNTLYVTNFLQNTVSILNAINGSFITSVKTDKGPFAVAVNPNNSAVYVANSDSSTVTVINVASHNVIATVNVGLHPQGIVVSPDGSTVYVTNLLSSTVSVIKASNNTVIATIVVGSNPYGLTISPDGSEIYVANAGSNNVNVIKTATNAIVATVGVGKQPFGVSITNDGSFVYVTDYGSNEVSIISTINNTITKTVSVGTSPYSLGSFISGGTICAGKSITFTITIDATPTVNIPNAFTPNGDGINDKWDLLNIENYPNCKVQIFNRYGARLFYSVGYPQSWNGQYNGVNVPDGVYYYIINLDSTLKPLSGPLTVIR